MTRSIVRVTETIPTGATRVMNTGGPIQAGVRGTGSILGAVFASLAGRVARDANANGSVDAADEPVDGAVVVLDGGFDRSRRATDGFDSMPSVPVSTR